MQNRVLKLKAQKGTLCQFWKLKTTPCAKAGSSKKASCSAAHPQYSQVWVYPPPPHRGVHREIERLTTRHITQRQKYKYIDRRHEIEIET